ncbi:MAG TPA: hypothetical protein VFD70_04540, partial [Anaerolineae bacterium]|nr:hypothetical protein [Anaerolineae bacterium]
SMGPMSGAALAAADQVVIPLSPDFLAFQVSAVLFRIIHRVQETINPQLQIAGIFLTMYDTRTKHAREILTHIRKTYGASVPFFSAVIYQSVKLKEATAQGQSIIKYAPQSQAARAYRVVARELVEGVPKPKRAPKERKPDEQPIPEPAPIASPQEAPAPIQATTPAPVETINEGPHSNVTAQEPEAARAAQAATAFNASVIGDLQGVRSIARKETAAPLTKAFVQTQEPPAIPAKELSTPVEPPPVQRVTEDNNLETDPARDEQVAPSPELPPVSETNDLQVTAPTSDLPKEHSAEPTTSGNAASLRETYAELLLLSQVFGDDYSSDEISEDVLPVESERDEEESQPAEPEENLPFYTEEVFKQAESETPENSTNPLSEDETQELHRVLASKFDTRNPADNPVTHQRAAAIARDDAGAWTKYAETANAPWDALNAWLHVLQLNPLNIYARERLDELVSSWLKVATRGQKEELLKLGHSLTEAGQLQIADKTYQRVTELDARDHRAWLGRALVTPNPLDRLVYVQQGLELAPGDPEIQVALAEAREKLSNEANKLLEEGEHLAQTGRTAQAHLMFKHVIELAPLDDRAWLGCARTADNLPSKISYLNQALEINPQNPEAQDLYRNLSNFMDMGDKAGWTLPFPDPRTILLGGGVLVLVLILGVLLYLLSHR